MKRAPKFYFSFRSPYSWIGARVLHQRIDPKAYGIELVPFFEPDEESTRLLALRGETFLYAPMSRAKHLYILQDIKRIVDRLGYKMTWPVDTAPRWEVSHLGWIVAKKHGKQDDYFWAVYKTRWEEGRDISNPDVIADVARSVGLDGDEVRGAIHDPAIREEGTEALVDICKSGVFGVPFFTLGFKKFWGIDRLEDFLEALGAPPAQKE
jgi:2-hydroxychromene-2-carboxylate isomerase